MQNPVYNAIAAAGYIAGVVLLIFLGANIFDEPDNILMPMGMLSLLVFSVAIMAYLFFYQPLILMMENKHAEAAQFFLTTLGIFACIVAAFLAAGVIISFIT